MKMIDHNHFICHLILGTFTEYPYGISRYFFEILLVLPFTPFTLVINEGILLPTVALLLL